MADGIQRYWRVGTEMEEADDGRWVLFSDVQARLERLERFEQAEAELLSGWDRAGLPPEPPLPNGDDEYAWSLRERLSYLLYLSNPSVAVEERTKGLQARLEAADAVVSTAKVALRCDQGMACECHRDLARALAVYRSVGKEQEGQK